jgi:hypothetical protein
MTLHALRLAVGDDDFFRILRTGTRTRAGDNVTTAGVHRLAERISGQSSTPCSPPGCSRPASRRASSRPGAAATSTTSGAGTAALLDRVRRKR